MIYFVFLLLLLLLGLLIFYYGSLPEYPLSTEEELIPWGMRWDQGAISHQPNPRSPHD